MHCQLSWMNKSFVSFSKNKNKNKTEQNIVGKKGISVLNANNSNTKS